MRWKSNSYITKLIKAHVKLFPSSSTGTVSVTSKLHCPEHIPVWNLSLLSRTRLLYSNPNPLSSQQSWPANLLQEARASEAGPRLPQTVCARTVQTQRSASTLSLAPTCPILHASHCVPCFPIPSATLPSWSAPSAASRGKAHKMSSTLICNVPRLNQGASLPRSQGTRQALGSATHCLSIPHGPGFVLLTFMSPVPRTGPGT